MQYQENIHFIPYMRASPYLIGIGVAFFLAKYGTIKPNRVSAIFI